MKRSIAFFVATLLVAMPLTTAYAYWNDRLDVDLTAMFIHPTQILVEEDEQLHNLNPILPLEEGAEVIEGGGSSEQNQTNEQTPVVEGEDLLQPIVEGEDLAKPDEDTAPVQDVDSQPVVEEEVETEQEEVNHDAVSEVAGP
ncbi:MAG: hypothetical protein Q3993_06460 [Filifactor alocis]|nr:hypothetical protein [Filifactor alocis]